MIMIPFLIKVYRKCFSSGLVSSKTTTMMIIVIQGAYISVAFCEKYRGQPLPKPNVEPPPDLPKQTVFTKNKQKYVGFYDGEQVFNGVSVNTASSLSATGILTCPSCQDACPAKRPCRCSLSLFLSLSHHEKYFMSQAKVWGKM